MNDNTINRPRVIAFYLPQFHPIPENDKWWGKGFTEWTNVGKAKPLFRGHYQPRVPADLGYYDLRVPETREAQANMAREAGVEGFCYWHYWFGNGKRLLERPFNEVLVSGKPDFPFCLAWANESWKGLDHGLKNRKTLIEQLYPGKADYEKHFYEVLPAFQDKRYITVDGKPLFMIYKPLATVEIKLFIELWRELAIKNGLKGIYFVGHCNEAACPFQQVLEVGVDAVNVARLNNYFENYRPFVYKVRDYVKHRWLNKPRAYSYKKISQYFLEPQVESIENVFPTIISGWDHTPRSGKDGLVLTHTTPELFGKHVRQACEIVSKKATEHKIILLKSWNEWAEGNFVEPDMKYGTKFLEALRDNLF